MRAQTTPAPPRFFCNVFFQSKSNQLPVMSTPNYMGYKASKSIKKISTLKYMLTYQMQRDRGVDLLFLLTRFIGTNQVFKTKGQFSSLI